MELEHRLYMRMAIDAAKNSKFEDDRVHPKVGAVLVKDSKVLGHAYRGEKGKGDHAEYTLLQKKLKDENITGSILYVTLEPCISRKSHEPCAEWIIKRGIKKVYIGILDPNRDICGYGFWKLRQKNIEVELFPPEYVKEIEEDNKEFVQKFLLEGGIKNEFGLPNPRDLPYIIPPAYRRLDDWYNIINRIYFDKNFHVNANSIFTHLVEILGGLSHLTTEKKKPGVEPVSHIAKAIVWWFALCGKMGIRSVEDMLYYKFPSLCPYCLKNPHNQDECKREKAKPDTPNWNKLFELGKKNNQDRPSSLSEWQIMFYNIYPVQQTEKYDAVFGRFTEEMGELAEAIRVFKIAPAYFLSEAADVFAWLMHLANLYESYQGIEKENRGKQFEAAIYNQYPDKCKVCYQPICSCPPILKSTLGRIAHNGPDGSFFIDSKNPFLTKAEIATQFDLGSKEIEIGDNKLNVTSDLIKEVYELSSSLASEIRKSTQIDDDSQTKLLEALHNLSSLALTQRISQTSVYKFLRTIIHLTSADRKLLKSFINKQKEGTFKNELIEYYKYIEMNIFPLKLTKN